MFAELPLSWKVLRFTRATGALALGTSNLFYAAAPPDHVLKQRVSGE